jgi:hypothetical protein
VLFRSEISKIVLDVNGKKIELSVEEAKELKDILGNLFGKVEIQKEFVPYSVPQPYIWREPYPYRYDKWYVTYQPTPYEPITTNGTQTNVLYCSTNTGIKGTY